MQFLVHELIDFQDHKTSNTILSWKDFISSASCRQWKKLANNEGSKKGKKQKNQSEIDHQLKSAIVDLKQWEKCKCEEAKEAMGDRPSVEV